MYLSISMAVTISLQWIKEAVWRVVLRGKPVETNLLALCQAALNMKAWASLSLRNTLTHMTSITMDRTL